MITGKHRREMEGLRVELRGARRIVEQYLEREYAARAGQVRAESEAAELAETVERQAATIRLQRERLDGRKAKIRKLEAYIAELKLKLTEKAA